MKRGSKPRAVIAAGVAVCLDRLSSKWLRAFCMYLDVLLLLLLSIGTWHCAIPLLVVGGLLAADD